MNYSERRLATADPVVATLIRQHAPPFNVALRSCEASMLNELRITLLFKLPDIHESICKFQTIIIQFNLSIPENLLKLADNQSKSINNNRQIFVIGRLLYMFHFRVPNKNSSFMMLNNYSNPKYTTPPKMLLKHNKKCYTNTTKSATPTQKYYPNTKKCYLNTNNVNPTHRKMIPQHKNTTATQKILPSTQILHQHKKNKQHHTRPNNSFVNHLTTNFTSVYMAPYPSDQITAVVWEGLIWRLWQRPINRLETEHIRTNTFLVKGEPSNTEPLYDITMVCETITCDNHHVFLLSHDCVSNVAASDCVVHTHDVNMRHTIASTCNNDTWHQHALHYRK